MTRRLVPMALLLAFFLLTAGCNCALNQLWNLIRDDATNLEEASITEDGVLQLAVRYESGVTWLVTAPLERGAEWPDTLGRRVRPFDGPLPRSAERLTSAPVNDKKGLVSVWFTYHHGKDGALSHTVWVTGEGYETVVDLPAPVDWSRGIAQVAVLLFPVTAVVDVVSTPVWGLWCFLTAGCHGRCWIPWCNELKPPIRR